jgi:hypothetical protein
LGRAERRAVRTAFASRGHDGRLLVRRKISDPWMFPKDGANAWFGFGEPALLRK